MVNEVDRSLSVINLVVQVIHLVRCSVCVPNNNFVLSMQLVIASEKV